MSVILMYHRVATPDEDPYGLAVHPERFSAHIEQLLATGRVASLEEVAFDRPPGQVVITFDDGYSDNATVAAPLLVCAGLPATWFITAGRLGRRRFWWDRLAEALLGPHPLPEAVDVALAERELWLDLRTAAERRTALLFLHRRLRPLPPDDLEQAVDRVVDALGAPKPSEDALTMTTDQVRALGALPGQDIGAHTLTHLQLRGQTETLQHHEIFGSVQALTELLGRSVHSFAYPFGSASAVGRLAPRLAAEAGCRFAVSTDPGQVTRRSDRHLLPRLNVGDWSGEEFAARLGAALRGH